MIYLLIPLLLFALIGYTAIKEDEVCSCIFGMIAWFISGISGISGILLLLHYGTIFILNLLGF